MRVDRRGELLGSKTACKYIEELTFWPAFAYDLSIAWVSHMDALKLGALVCLFVKAKCKFPPKSQYGR
jgi:hypothetical protein